jgi:hypothetical protein
MNAPAQRSADGRLLPGNTVGIAGARPRNIVTELKIRYENRIPELLEGLFLLTKSDSPHVRIAATRELLDRLIGKPQSAHSHIVPSAPMIEEKASEIKADPQSRSPNVGRDGKRARHPGPASHSARGRAESLSVRCSLDARPDSYGVSPVRPCSRRPAAGCA